MAVWVSSSLLFLNFDGPLFSSVLTAVWVSSRLLFLNFDGPLFSSVVGCNAFVCGAHFSGGWFCGPHFSFQRFCFCAIAGAAVWVSSRPLFSTHHCPVVTRELSAVWASSAPVN